MKLSYFVHLCVCPSVRLSVYPFVYAHVHLSVVHLSVFQVAIERKETLFIDDPTQFPGLEKNEDYVKYGYGYYLGAPWAVGDTRGEVEWKWGRKRREKGSGQWEVWRKRTM